MNITKGFLNPPIPKINGILTYKTICHLHLQLNVNAASVHSADRGGENGLLALAVMLTIYATTSNVSFLVPINHGAEPTFPDKTTGLRISEIFQQHKENLRMWREYHATDKASYSTTVLHTWTPLSGITPSSRQSTLQATHHTSHHQ